MDVVDLLCGNDSGGVHATQGTVSTNAEQRLFDYVSHLKKCTQRIVVSAMPFVSTGERNSHQILSWRERKLFCAIPLDAYTTQNLFLSYIGSGRWHFESL